MSIQNELDKIKSAIKGQDVRGAIHDSIKKAYDDASEQGNANMEVEMARGHHPTLVERLIRTDQKQTDLMNEVDGLEKAKINKGEVSVLDIDKNKGKLDQTYMTDGFVEQFVENTLPVNAIPADGSLTVNKMAFPVVVGKRSKNLFDKTNVTTNKYVAPSNGNLWGNENYVSSDYIKLKPNTTYVISNKLNIQTYAIYDGEKIFSRGFSGTTTAGENYQSFTTTPTERFVRLSINKKQMDVYQLEEGSEPSGYESFGNKITPDLILGNAAKHENVLVVAKSGGDFKTISDAVRNAEDTKNNPITILVMPGVYDETVSTAGRYLNIIGVDRETCIIKRSKADYDAPCLWMGSHTKIKGFTLILSDEDRGDGVYNNGYAIHMDAPSPDPAEQAKSTIEDCNIVNYINNACVGVGLRNNQTLEIINSNLYKKHEGLGGALFWHTSVADEVNQHLTVKDCEIRAVDGNGVRLIDSNIELGASGGSNYRVTFINNTIYSDVKGKVSQLQKTPIVGDSISGNIKLTEDSHGNNVDIFNA